MNFMILCFLKASRCHHPQQGDPSQRYRNCAAQRECSTSFRHAIKQPLCQMTREPLRSCFKSSSAKMLRIIVFLVGSPSCLTRESFVWDDSPHRWGALPQTHLRCPNSAFDQQATRCNPELLGPAERTCESPPVTVVTERMRRNVVLSEGRR